MELLKINTYKIERTESLFRGIYQPMKKGDEQQYESLLFAMEHNLLKLHRKNRKLTSLRVIEAINLALIKIYEVLKEVKYETDFYENLENGIFCNKLQMSYDPFCNQLINSMIAQDYDLEKKEVKLRYFEDPFKCLVRIKESIQMWEKELGMNGYFKFLENTIGVLVSDDDDEMKYIGEIKHLG